MVSYTFYTYKLKVTKTEHFSVIHVGVICHAPPLNHEITENHEYDGLEFYIHEFIIQMKTIRNIRNTLMLLKTLSIVHVIESEYLSKKRYIMY